MTKTTITSDELPDGAEEWARVPNSPPRPCHEPERRKCLSRAGEKRVVYYQPGAEEEEHIDAPRGLERRSRR